MNTVFALTLTLFLWAEQPVKVIFDIPHLQAKSIVQIKKILGKPKSDFVPSNYQRQAGATGDAVFEKGEFSLEITYDPITKKVIDLFISKDHSVKDIKELEIAGNVLNSKQFILSPVRENKNPLLFTGVTITPK